MNDEMRIDENTPVLEETTNEAAVTQTAPVEETAAPVAEEAEAVTEEVAELIAEEVVEPVAEEATVEVSEPVAEAVAEKPEEEMTMEELMQKYDHPVRMGQIIKGKVIQLDDKEAIIALIGAGNDGKLALDEVSFDDSAKLTDLMSIGDEVEAKIIRRPIENDSFYILSVKEVQREASKDELLAVLGKDETIPARVKEAVKGGLVAFYKGHRIFIPASHVDVNSVRDLKQFVGQEIDINVIEAEERRGSTRIVGSRKKHMLKEKQALEGKTWEELEVDQVHEGRVERLTDFGAFISINGVDGLLHISEITHGKIPKPSSVLKVGDMVQVKIIGIDKENKKLSLSMKALQEDPWKNISEKYPNESIVLGKVVRFTDFGAFIELEPGVDGLAHISQLSHARVEKPSDVLTIGDIIKVMVLDSNEKDKKVSLSVKAVE
ncbi:S1 RNA-binding domain-containing protein [Proteiniclasticum sp. QWL-01]|uniref:S1 RNA-binding domain-containing protein n=1 Tax=Proteiniclasticum sp. QWL-01 TaxID=3036945 RepID=UPI0024100D57|nr:S1 RNA-binding domain-containing protein [Proteiniclasticum sp. QWL-01]WFF71444.1 S1 RNA-binding domain-containing protein [Proteiniclasticum sp. QWL-01]